MEATGRMKWNRVEEEETNERTNERLARASTASFGVSFFVVVVGTISLLVFGFQKLTRLISSLDPIRMHACIHTYAGTYRQHDRELFLL